MPRSSRRSSNHRKSPQIPYTSVFLAYSSCYFPARSMRCSLPPMRPRILGGRSYSRISPSFSISPAPPRADISVFLPPSAATSSPSPPLLGCPRDKGDIRKGRCPGGRGRFSERSASPPRPLSPEERLGISLSFLSGLASPCSMRCVFLSVVYVHGGVGGKTQLSVGGFSTRSALAAPGLAARHFVRVD